MILALLDILILMIFFKTTNDQKARRAITALVIISYISSTFDIWSFWF